MAELDSGVIKWAEEFCINGSMRSWIDLDPDLCGGTEGMLWTASLVLLHHLETTKPAGWWRGKRVLECGSGTGHLAVGLGRLGAHVVATESAESHNGSLSSGYVTMTNWTRTLLSEREGGGQPVAEIAVDGDDGPLSAGSAGGTVEVRAAALSAPRCHNVQGRCAKQSANALTLPTLRCSRAVPQAALGPRRFGAQRLGRLRDPSPL